jgi:putative N6-adenine-specific DNA methylase
MNGGQDIGLFMKGFGDFLKQQCTGSTAYVYFGTAAHQDVGLRTAWRNP